MGEFQSLFFFLTISDNILEQNVLFYDYFAGLRGFSPL